MDIISALAGIALLILSRKLFWFLVGVTRFVFGIDLAAQLFQTRPEGSFS